ncbi:hypothetical protein ACUXAV_006588 [Cupriavidus metallidurans]|jgi:hypothetical protein|uniref:Uncharacterized protein n=2 Tax=Cupriavidus TaxID=106589 RepID=A0A3G8GW65_9BURK|nr:MULTISPECIES: hypothetical protein [Cupriavidus]MCA3774965.1 hypothetical protein [Cutibacterium sp.]AZG12185.1 hypothetical protein EHF44_01595 [Cupriavidus pauculus]MCA3194153.1 hypothetical protein [Cupriavidus sp.]MCA3235684.1 hypothetical protein [Cupriavidus sp.]MDE4922503.1 hypothetical protein [Cupriavidus metallidurans]
MAKNRAVLGFLADLLKNLSFATFGLFGFGAAEKMVKGAALTSSDVVFAVLGSVLFVGFNAVALWLLKDDE